MPEAIIGGATSVIGGILGAHAAHDAADAQKKAAQAAQAEIEKNQTSSNAYQTDVANQQRSLLSPYTTAGSSAIGNLSQLLQPGGELTKGYGDFQAPTNVTEQNDPGFQFRLKQGMEALQNSAAAKGGLLSGNTAKAINDYAQNSASNEYGNVYNRALQNYATNFNTFNTNQGNLYGRLSGIAGLGAQAGSSLGGLLQSGANNTANINNSASGMIAGQLNNQGAAQASGIMGANNAWQGALGGVANNLTSYLSAPHNNLAKVSENPLDPSGGGWG